MGETSLDITSIPPTWETKKSKRRKKENKKDTPKSTAVLVIVGRRGSLKK